MTSHNQYNPVIYTGLRLGAGAVAVAALFAAAMIAFKSGTGAIYNPLFRIPAWIINNAFDRPFLASSTADLDSLTTTGANVFGDFITSTFYIIVMGCATFYLVVIAGSFIAGHISDYALRYKLGEEGAAEFKRKEAKRFRVLAEKKTAVSDLEKSRRQHYEQWKKFNKSTLSYQEWKSRYSD